MLPWTWTIAYRRFNQGVMIRFGRSRSVGAGTVVRLTAGLTVLLIGLAIGTLPGIVVATSAVAAGVTSEAIFAGPRRAARPAQRTGRRARWSTPHSPTGILPVLYSARPDRAAKPDREPHRQRSAQPHARPDLVAGGLAGGYRPGLYGARAWASCSMKWSSRCSTKPGLAPCSASSPCILVAGTTAISVPAIAATPLSRLWFAGRFRSPTRSCRAGVYRLWIALPLAGAKRPAKLVSGPDPALPPHAQITEAVVIFLVVDGAILIAGWPGGMTGLYVGLVAMVAAWLHRLYGSGCVRGDLRRKERRADRAGRMRPALRLRRLENRNTGFVDKGVPASELLPPLDNHHGVLPAEPERVRQGEPQSAPAGRWERSPGHTQDPASRS